MFNGFLRLPFKRLNGPLDTKNSRLGQFTHLQLKYLSTFQPQIVSNSTSNYYVFKKAITNSGGTVFYLTGSFPGS